MADKKIKAPRPSKSTTTTKPKRSTGKQAVSPKTTTGTKQKSGGPSVTTQTATKLAAEQDKPVAEAAVVKGVRKDSTVRASLKPSDAQPGPTAESRGRTTKTQSTTSAGAKARKEPVLGDDDYPQPRLSKDQTFTASDVAARQPIRQSELPTPTERHVVDGEPVEVVALPHRVDPEELSPLRRDTIIKDNLRAEGRAEEADSPVVQPVGGQWQDTEERQRADNEEVT